MIMSSAINPLGTSSQASVAGNQLNKPMHPQGTTPSYVEPSHVPQSLGIMHTNTNAAHSHTSQHLYSLNVPNTTGHYINQNMGQIPASNHPVANPSSTAAGQGFNPQKNASNHVSSYEENVLPQQNPIVHPPASQTLPAVMSSQPSIDPAETASEALEQQRSEKPQSNGTPEVKSTQKNDTSSFSLLSKEKSVQPAPVPQLSQVQEKAEEKPIAVATSLPTQTPQLKSLETTNAKSSPSICHDPQHTEPFAAVTTPNSTSPTNTENNDKSVSAIIREPELKKVKMDEKPTSSEQLETPKKTKSVESDNEVNIENNISSKVTEPTINNEEKARPKEKLETPKKTKSVESDNEVNIENNISSKVTEPTINNEEKARPKEKQVSVVTPPSTETSVTKSPTRKTKHQAPKLDESSKTPKEPKISVQKSPSISKAKRQRIRTQPYQSPLPEVELISKISSLTPRTPRSNDDKLIVFYKNEFLAVRNAEGSFYLCQAVQNIYKSSTKIKIRWLSQDKNDKTGEIYTPDFYDLTDFDCILTNLSLGRIDKRTFRLPRSEKDRTQSILNRSLAVEKGEVTSPSLTEEHPDGLDLSLYRDEDQLKKRDTRKRKAGRKPSNSSSAEKEVSIKKSPETPKVRKVSPPTKTTAKNTGAKKTQQSLKNTSLQPEIKKSAPSSTRAPSRGKRKKNNTTSPVVDQNKAKVLAKIGRKTAVPAAKSTQSNAKNAKSGSKAASSKKATQIKTSLSAAAKNPPRNARRSTRK